MNNKTGINITDADVVQMIEKNTKTSTNKKKKSSSKKKTTTNRRSNKKKRQINIDFYSDEENFDQMDYETDVRRQLDVAIDQTKSISDNSIWNIF